jgi:glutamyl-tRNA reductase
MKALYVLVFVIPVILLVSSGCSKKEPPAGPSKPSATTTETLKTEAAKAEAAVTETAEAAKEKVTEAVQEVKAALPEVDLSKTLDAIKQEAAGLDLAKLQEVAKKYKDMLTEKQAALKPLMDKLAKIPLTERLSPESQALTGETKSLSDTIKGLTERLAVYVEAIKAKGGDAAGLTP